MANFGAALTEAPPIQNNITPKQGIVTEPTMTTGINNLLKGVVNTMQQNSSNRAVSEFQSSQLAIIQAVDQGAMTSLEARTRLRANLDSYSLAHGSLVDKFLSINSKLMGSAGMGSVVLQGTQAEQRTAKIYEQMINENFVPANTSDAAMASLAPQYLEYKQAQRELSDKVTLMNAKITEGTLTSSEMKLEEQKLAQSAKSSLISKTPFLLNALDNQIGQLMADGSIDPAARTVAFEKYWQGILSDMAEPLSYVTGVQRDAILKALEARHALGLRQVSGELQLASTKNETDQIMANLTATVAADPRGAWVLWNLKTAPNSVTSLNIGSDRDLQRIISKSLGSNVDTTTGEVTPDSSGVNPFPDKSPTSDRALNSFFKLLGRDPSNEEERQQIGTQIFNLFNGISNHEGFIKSDPKRGVALVGWLASKDFLELRNKYPNSFPNIDEVKSIWSTNFANQVWEMAGKEFRNNKIINLEKYQQALKDVASGGKHDVNPQTFENIPTQDSIKVKTPDRITFTWAKDTIVFEAIDPSNKIDVQKAAELNKELAPVLNNTVKSLAHLGGNTNYQDVFNSIIPTVLGTTKDQNPAIGDNITVVPSDFKTRLDATPFKGVSDSAYNLVDTLSGSFAPHQLAGILGNAAVESGAKFSPTAVGDNGNALGIFQWNGPRMRALKVFAKRQGTDPKDEFTQIAFLMEEFKTTEKRAYRKLIEAKTPEEAALAFSTYYERPGVPNNDKRIQWANKFYEMLTGNSP